jgi:dUTPase
MKRRDNYILNMYIDSSSQELMEKYKNAIQTHNKNVMELPYPDSGFDLFTPESTIADMNRELSENFQEFKTRQTPIDKTTKADMKVKTAMFRVDTQQNTQTPTGYYMYARSSISKTCLRLANNQGIIDSGYRGNLIGMFDILNRRIENAEQLESYHRLLQICSPTLEPFTIELVSDKNLLGVTTRGEGGLGSTGVT